MTAIRGIAKARWWILLAAAALAVVASGRMANYQNENMLTNEAITSITFIEDPTNLDRGDFVQFLEEQHVLAEDANLDLLNETPGPFLPWQLAEIHLVNDQNQIIFIGRGYTQGEADQRALVLRETYLSVSTVGAGQERMSQDLDDLMAQIGELRAQMAQRRQSPPFTEEELATQAHRAALETRIGAFQGQYGALGVELMNPILRSAEAVQAEIDRVLDELVRLEVELASMPLPPTPEETQAADEQLVLDQLKLTQLETRWQQLYVLQLNLASLTTVSDVAAGSVTVFAGSTRTSQALALAGALIVATLALVVIERTRGIVWSGVEFEESTAVLAELPSRGLHIFDRPTDEPWYLSVLAGRRKAAVQLIRSLLDGYQNAVIVFQGTGVLDEDTLDLSADVAVSAAVSGRNVLLIDASFSHKNRLVEYGTDLGADLTSLLQNGPEDPQAVLAEIKTVLLARPEVQRDLRSLRSGSGDLDAGDALAGQRFEMILEVVRELFDLIIVAGANFGEPTSHILAQRVDYAILVGSIGHTIDRQVEAAERDFKIRRAELLGIVLIRRRRNRLTRSISPQVRNVLWDLVDRIRPPKEGAQPVRNGFRDLLEQEDADGGTRGT